MEIKLPTIKYAEKLLNSNIGIQKNKLLKGENKIAPNKTEVRMRNTNQLSNQQLTLETFNFMDEISIDKTGSDFRKDSEDTINLLLTYKVREPKHLFNESQENFRKLQKSRTSILNIDPKTLETLSNVSESEEIKFLLQNDKLVFKNSLK